MNIEILACPKCGYSILEISTEMHPGDLCPICRKDRLISISSELKDFNISGLQKIIYYTYGGMTSRKMKLIEEITELMLADGIEEISEEVADCLNLIDELEICLGEQKIYPYNSFEKETMTRIINLLVTSINKDDPDNKKAREAIFILKNILQDYYIQIYKLDTDKINNIKKEKCIRTISKFISD